MKQRLPDKQKRIAVDIDDVLASSAQGFVDYSNKRWGTSLTIDDYREHWGKMWQVDDDEYKRRAKEVHAAKAFLGFAVHQDAINVLKQLAKEYELIIVTSRVRAIEADTKEWINVHYQGLFTEIHHGGFYETITEEAHLLTKAQICQELDVDYLIDDQPKHCFASAEVGITALLFGNYPWNQAKSLPDKVIRVSDWDAVERYFREQASQKL